MATKQIIGTDQPLSHSGTGSPSSDPKGGTKQVVGTSLPLPKDSVQSPSANPIGGMKQVVGTSASLNRTPIKGWPVPNYHTPMSPRAVKQSETVGTRKGKS